MYLTENFSNTSDTFYQAEFMALHCVYHISYETLILIFIYLKFRLTAAFNMTFYFLYIARPRFNVP